MLSGYCMMPLPFNYSKASIIYNCDNEEVQGTEDLPFKLYFFSQLAHE